MGFRGFLPERFRERLCENVSLPHRPLADRFFVRSETLLTVSKLLNVWLRLTYLDPDDSQRSKRICHLLRFEGSIRWRLIVPNAGSFGESGWVCRGGFPDRLLSLRNRAQD